jgi:hypothetical protein
MIQHPVVKGFEPDADVLSIHIALDPTSALATPEYCVKDQPEAETSGTDEQDPPNEIGPNDIAFGETAWAFPRKVRGRGAPDNVTGRLANRV